MVRSMFIYLDTLYYSNGDIQDLVDLLSLRFKELKGDPIRLNLVGREDTEKYILYGAEGISKFKDTFWSILKKPFEIREGVYALINSSVKRSEWVPVQETYFETSPLKRIFL